MVNGSTNMSDPSHKLADLQRWMQTVITHPAGIRQGITSDEAQSLIHVDEAHVTDVITRSRDRTATERLEVYGNAYFARLLECMRDLFPALMYTFDEDVFDQFAVGYLIHHPSQSYTLGRLADRFVDYLEETSRADREGRITDESQRVDGTDDEDSGKKHRTADAPDTPDFADFVIDVARLESTIDEVFDGPGVEKEEVLTAERLQSIKPSEWPAARLVPVCCLRLLRFRYPVSEYYTEFRRGQEPAPPEPAETFLAVTRRDYVVRRIELSRLQYDLLSALVAGATVGQAIAQTAATADDADSLAASLEKWFTLWSAERLFQRVELADEGK